MARSSPTGLDGPAKSSFFERNERVLGIALPVLTLVATLAAWEFYIYATGTPSYQLPAPSDIVKAMIIGWPVLFASLLITLRIALSGLLSAVIGGVVIAVMFTRSRWVEMCFSPYAVILQVTPLIAIAPLLNIYFGFEATIYLSAFIVGFFPILSNTLTGLRSTDHGLVNLFQLYGASPLDVLLRSAIAERPALFPVRVAGRRWAFAHWRDRCRTRIWRSRRRNGPCLPHHRIRLSRQHPAHVRCRRSHLRLRDS